MNNLKFRAWDKMAKKMSKVTAIDFSTEPFRVFYKAYGNENYFNKDVILMQSTGLFDKNGVEIFEGDIVEFPEVYVFFDFEEGLTGVDGFNIASVVKRGNYVTLDNFAGEDGATERELENYKCTFDDLDFKNFEVIGNIYENKELLR